MRKRMACLLLLGLCAYGACCSPATAEGQLEVWPGEDINEMKYWEMPRRRGATDDSVSMFLVLNALQYLKPGNTMNDFIDMLNQSRVKYDIEIVSVIDVGLGRYAKDMVTLSFSRFFHIALSGYPYPYEVADVLAYGDYDWSVTFKDRTQDEILSSVIYKAWLGASSPFVWYDPSLGIIDDFESQNFIAIDLEEMALINKYMWGYNSMERLIDELEAYKLQTKE